MIDFQLVRITDKEKLNPFLVKSNFRSCDFSFANIFCWKQKYQTSFAIQSGFLFIRFYAGGKKAGYMFPLGDGSIKTALEMIITDAEERNEPFRMFALTNEMYSLIEPHFPNGLIYQTNRNWAEYIYNSQDLITLTGKRFQSKRNHINKFKRSYRYEYSSIIPEIIPECLELYDRWCKENGDCSSEALLLERIVTQTAFDNFDKLELKGGAIRIDNQIIAYTYGQQISDDTFCVHAEKSLYEIDGGFTMINQQFAEHEGSGFSYINREEDLGLESLRQAKMSYHPVILLEKGFITFQ